MFITKNIISPFPRIILPTGSCFVALFAQQDMQCIICIMFIMFICIQSPKQKMKINSHNLQGLRLQHLVKVELKLQKTTEINARANSLEQKSYLSQQLLCENFYRQ